MFNSYKEHLWTIAAHIANGFEIVFVFCFVSMQDYISRVQGLRLLQK